MAPGGDPTPRDQWITTYEANWDPRNFYEADLDGIPLPADRYLHLHAHLYKLPDGFPASIHRSVHGGTGYLSKGGIGGGHYNNLFHQLILRNGGYKVIPEADILRIRDILVDWFAL
jgi:hypothetical protein